MKAFVRSIRIAPKKANIVAKMVRGAPVREAMHQLQHINKKAARILEQLLKAAIANAQHNAKQNQADLFVKTVIVNKAQHFKRGVPMARGKVRPIQKFSSHIFMALGVRGEGGAKGEKKDSSRKTKNPVQTKGKAPGKAKKASKDTSISQS